MEAKQLFKKYATDDWGNGFTLMDEEHFTQAIAEIISLPVEAPVILQKCDKKFENFRDEILAREKEGKIVIATWDGFMEADLDKIIDQPTEGLLYDLNRDRVTVLTFIEDKKWVNDFACMKVIEKLKALLPK